MFVYIYINIYYIHICTSLCVFVCACSYRIRISHVLIPHLLQDLRCACSAFQRNVLSFSTQGDLPLGSGGQGFHGVEDLRESE